MGYFKSMEVSGVTTWMHAVYVDDSGEEYEVVFTKSYDRNLDVETRELVHVEKEDISIDSQNAVWREIQLKIERI
jgi:hypothetical protein